MTFSSGTSSRRPDEVLRGRRRGRHHHVDPLAPNDPDRRGDRGQVPGHVLVGEEQPAAERARVDERPLGAGRPVQLLGARPSLRADEANTVDPRLRRHLELLVAVDPLRVFRSEHVGLDPEPGQVRRELERPLHAAAARGREVERDEQDLHAGER
ncbi:MAG TPA: hypothetical protein VFI37_01235 [Gaiellaceae bacterium]|nr:hypothetical protein [Gaiellaceae bacterium]